MRILITGAMSLLGKSLLESAPPAASVLLTDLPNRRPFHSPVPFQPLDVSEAGSVRRLMEHFRPGLVIHLAAESNVDTCQKHPHRARLVNVKGTKHILKYSKIVGAKVLFTSSNAIFGGNGAPYSEQSKPKPVNVYGKSKLAAEQLVRSAGLPYLITRLITMYGWPPDGARENPVTWALAKMKNGEKLNMVNDRYLNPLYAPSAAEAIWKLTGKGKQGTFHVAGKTRVNRYEWTVHTARVFGFEPQTILPVGSSFFPLLTNRPVDTTYSTKKIERTIVWKPMTLQRGLTQMRNAMQ